ncbi:uncharacterized protein J7T54_005953 [Emericellopsis cladophorae]|uniref:BTB domain-containing protein n=1 Tax=Emericellopsis cladophorae TaxID=2686198 RepID=A0A9P9Y8N5_9HYPO|nr:uncharacterized protein J7T54_005953 [Emericellopsis cladophorae]KAI6785619.1 hypothetical protein J7T54_005953 [Emericellopsis cladophorae]
MASMSFAHKAFHWSLPGFSRPSLDKHIPAKSRGDSNNNNHNNSSSNNVSVPVAGTPHARSHSEPQPPHPAPIAKRKKPAHQSVDDGLATVLVGPQKRPFKVNRNLLCATSSFFAEQLNRPSHHRHDGSPRAVSLWLPGELPSMFALFVQWLHNPRHTFRRMLDDAIAIAQDDNGIQGLNDIHWAMIRLHLFASHLGIYHLQDSAMDALQDLYLKCDWDVTPGLVSYLYTKCDGLAAVRLRRWAVAMVAFSLTGNTATSVPSPIQDYPDEAGSHVFDAGDDMATQFQCLIDSVPELHDDYSVHIHKMTTSGLDLRFKNPQLRIPANKLRNDERAFGFRECSFHSHRATVGEKRCPHERKRMRSIVAEDPVLLAAQLAGAKTLAATPLVEEDAVPRPLFSREGGDAEERDKAVKHVRSVSSTLRT